MDRFFYHCFPRRKDTASGLGILSSMLNSGLLLTPEVVLWPGLRDGTPQIRISFTELAPDELPAHAHLFGDFALEFRIEDLKRFGALPVFYLPTAQGPFKGYEGAGLFVVSSIARLQTIFQNLMDLEKAEGNWARIPIAKGQTLNLSPPELQLFNKVLKASIDGFESIESLWYLTVALQALFYPADDLKRENPLAYYRQREWRIIDNIVCNGQWPREVAREEKDKISIIDLEFFGSQFTHPSLKRSLIDNCRILEKLDGVHIMSCVNRILAPPGVLGEARSRVEQSAFKQIPVEPLPARVDPKECPDQAADVRIERADLVNRHSNIPS